MSKEIILPDLGMDMDEALLINWTKNPGDSIKEGDVIAEVETDKTTVEVESTVAGTILEWKYDPGENIRIGDVIGYVGEAGESAPAGGNGSAAPKAEAPATESKPETEKAPVMSNGDTPTTDTGRIKASPIAKRVADERGIDLEMIGAGTGPGGRIIKKDVENFTPQKETAPAPEKPKAAPSVALPDHIGYIAGPSYGKMPQGDGYDYEDISKLRARIAERMVTSQQQVPHFYVTMEINMDALMELRQQLNNGIEDKAKRISVNDMIVKAVGLAARQFPNVNRHYYGDQYVVNKRVNVGIAVALDGGGLINVVAHDADRLSLSILAEENRAKIQRVRDGKVKPEDITGATLTVSNLGMYGVDNFVAIVTPPEAAILAIGAAKKTPIVKEDGTLGVATLMKITLSADHRTVNGAEGGEFMAYLRDLLENPMRLL